MKNNNLDQIIKDIEHYFAFLFTKGYSISRAENLSMGDWEVILKSINSSIVLYSDHGEINLAFAPSDSNINNQIGIRTMIYLLSNEKKFIGKYEKSIVGNRHAMFERLASLLTEYIDQIIPYFGMDFEKYKYELSSARTKYNDIFISRYILKKD